MAPIPIPPQTVLCTKLMQHPVSTPVLLHPKHHPIPINTPSTRHPIQPTALPLYQLHQQRIGSILPPKRMQHLKAGSILSYPIHHPFTVQPPFLRHSVEPPVFGGEDTGIGQGAIGAGEGMKEVEVGAIGGKGEEGAVAGGSSCGGGAVEVSVSILSEGSEGEGSVLVGEVGLEGSEGVKDTKAGAVGGEGEEKAGVLGAMEGCGGIEASVGGIEEGIRVEGLVEGDVVEEGRVEGEVRFSGLFGGGYHGNAGEDGEGNGSKSGSQLGSLGQLAGNSKHIGLIQAAYPHLWNVQNGTEHRGFIGN